MENLNIFSCLFYVNDVLLPDYNIHVVTSFHSLQNVTNKGPMLFFQMPYHQLVKRHDCSLVFCSSVLFEVKLYNEGVR